jgi:3-oxoacyl-[acyl-carrier-protein] synthase-3
MVVNSVITGTGSLIPEQIVDNESFLKQDFFDGEKNTFPYDNKTIIEKFKAITGIESRRYLKGKQNSSDIGTAAAKIAIKEAGIDPEKIDQIIFAQNFGDITEGSHQIDMLPCLASRVKYNLGIENPNCVAYDILFGCPGWIQGVIQAHAYINSGIAKAVLVIGSETLSRVVDPFDRDSMIYSDGAGACIIERKEEAEKRGILSFANQSFTKEEAYYLYYGSTFNPADPNQTKFIKMHGRKIYEFAVTHVPAAMKACFDESGEDIHDVKKIFIHQANEKMDFAIVKRFFKLYNFKNIPKDIMPMSIHKLGNSSVATVPTLYDLVNKDQLEGHHLNKGDLVILASVGAGMHINAITYRV